MLINMALCVWVFSGLWHVASRLKIVMWMCVEGQLHGFFALAGIKQELEELLGCKVDIVRLRDRMDSFLRERIQREGIYV